MSCDSKKVFKGLELLYPRRILKNKANFRDLPLLGYVEADELAPLEEEYRRVGLVDWEMEVGGPVPREPIEFWIMVKDYRRGDAAPLAKLADFALDSLLIPSSTAMVERIFSQVTYIKSKYRNRLHAA